MRAPHQARVVLVALVAVVLGLIPQSAAHAELTFTLSNFGAPSVLSTLVVDSAAHRGYAAAQGRPEVVVFDTEAKRTLGTVPVAAAVGALAIDPALHRLYVAHSDGTLSEIDTVSDSVLDRIDVGVRAVDMAVDADSHQLYLVPMDQHVVVVDPDPGREPLKMALPGSPARIAVDSVRHRAYVTQRGADSGVTIIDTTTRSVLTTIAVGPSPYALAVDQDAGRLYVVDTDDSLVRVLDTDDDRVVASFGNHGEAAFAIALDPDLHLGYVSNYGSASLTVFDTGRAQPLTRVDHVAPTTSLGVDTETHQLFVPGFLQVGVVTPSGSRSQSIEIVSPVLPQVAVGQTLDLAAVGGGSRNPVTFAVDPATTHRACMIVGTGNSSATLAFLHRGTCVVDADQAGDELYEPAAQLVLTIAVGSPQSVTFTSTAPSDPSIGDAYRVRATGSPTGLPVVLGIASGSADVCRFVGPGHQTGPVPSPHRVRFTGLGRCVITARQRGDGVSAPSPRVKQVVEISAGAVPSRPRGPSR